MRPKAIKLLLAASLTANLVFASVFVYRRFFSTPFTSDLDQWNVSRSDVFNDLPVDSTSIVFIGTSHTEGFPLNELYPQLPIKKMGVMGNHTYHILERFYPVIEKRPAKIFIEAGANDIKGPEEPIIFYLRRIALMAKRSGIPTYIFSLLPVCKSSLQFQPKVERINQRLKQITDSLQITYIDLSSPLMKNNALDSSLTYDGMHLNAKGYHIWQRVIEPYFLEDTHKLKAPVFY